MSYDTTNSDLEVWLRAYCPECGKDNWHQDDSTDFTEPDVEGMICHECKHCWLIADPEDYCEPDDQGIVEGLRRTFR